MKKTIFIGILLSGLVLGSCGGHDKNESATEVSESSTVESDQKKRPHYKSLKLNEGEKWAANIETTTGVAKMVVLANTELSDATIEDYQALADSYNTELNTIFSECSMKGAAHDQLHNFLLPLIEKVKKLKATNTTVEGAAIAEDIQKHLDLYLNYFE